MEPPPQALEEGVVQNPSEHVAGVQVSNGGVDPHSMLEQHSEPSTQLYPPPASGQQDWLPQHVASSPHRLPTHGAGQRPPVHAWLQLFMQLAGHSPGTQHDPPEHPFPQLSSQLEPHSSSEAQQGPGVLVEH